MKFGKFLASKRSYRHPIGMDTRVMVPENEPPATIREVVLALNSQKLEAHHNKQNWGDWIEFKEKKTVISIESNRGLASSATIEEVEGEDEVFGRIITAFRKMGWEGEDEDGRYPL